MADQLSWPAGISGARFDDAARALTLHPAGSMPSRMAWLGGAARCAFLILAAISAAGCASDEGDDPCSAAAIDAIEEAADRVHQPDYETLSGCGTSVCQDGFVQRIEGGAPATINDMGCILAAMRDRTPGSYRVTLDHTWSNGYQAADYVLVMTSSGEVDVGVHRHRDVESCGNPARELWEPTARCSLVAPGFFADCLALAPPPAAEEPFPEETYPDEAWDCIYPDTDAQQLPWFESCAEAPPSCD